MKPSLELRAKREDLTKKARQIYDKAQAEKRSPNSEEIAEFDKIMDEVDGLGTKVGDLEQAERVSDRLAAAERSLTQPVERQSEPSKPAGSKSERRAKAKFEKRRKEYGDHIARRSSQEYRAFFNRYLREGRSALLGSEQRALQADADVVGGYLIPPIQFVNKLILFLKDLVFIRQLATIQPVLAAQSLGIPSLDADPTDSDWTSELATGTEDSQMAFGRRDLSPHPLAKRIKLSNKLLRLAPSAEPLVMDRLGYKFAVTEEKAFLTGNGSQQPLGVFVASPMGISTARDCNVGNTTTAMTADGLIECKYNLKAQYQKEAAWIFHRVGVKNVRKLKDANGQYLWAPGLGDGEPDTILDRPFYMSEYCPSTFTTGQYVGILGAWRFYWIADSLNMSIQRLDELYAETNQVGYIARRELDAMPVLEEAFSRVTLA